MIVIKSEYNVIKSKYYKIGYCVLKLNITESYISSVDKIYLCKLSLSWW